MWFLVLLVLTAQTNTFTRKLSATLAHLASTVWRVPQPTQATALKDTLVLVVPKLLSQLELSALLITLLLTTVLAP